MPSQAVRSLCASRIMTGVGGHYPSSLLVIAR